MEKEQNSKSEEKKNKKSEPLEDSSKEKEIKLTPEEKINDLEDKLTRALAEMENQRRRFEKEKEDAFEYGGFSFARESLNLIDNFDRAKQSLENDEKIDYKIVGKDEADLKQKLLFFRSPIGKGLIGKNKGDLVEVSTPAGVKNFEIIDVKYI